MEHPRGFFQRTLSGGRPRRRTSCHPPLTPGKPISWTEPTKYSQCSRGAGPGPCPWKEEAQGVTVLVHGSAPSPRHCHHEWPSGHGPLTQQSLHPAGAGFGHQSVTGLAALAAPPRFSAGRSVFLSLCASCGAVQTALTPEC